MAYVYRFRHFITNEVIYVGKTKRDIKKRMDEHFGIKGHLSKKCYSKVGKIEYLKVNSDADARLVEQYMINRYKPRYNVDGKANDNHAFKFNLFMGLNYLGRWKLYERKRYSFFKLRFIRFGFLKTKNEIVSKCFDLGMNLFIIYIIFISIIQNI
ncbi:GIY-YIG nuclease family protein [Paraclostridium tenue]